MPEGTKSDMWMPLSHEKTARLYEERDALKKENTALRAQNDEWYRCDNCGGNLSLTCYSCGAV